MILYNNCICIYFPCFRVRERKKDKEDKISGAKAKYTKQPQNSRFPNHVVVRACCCAFGVVMCVLFRYEQHNAQRKCFSVQPTVQWSVDHYYAHINLTDKQHCASL